MSEANGSLQELERRRGAARHLMLWAGRGLAALCVAGLWLGCGAGEGVRGATGPGPERPANTADTGDAVSQQGDGAQAAQDAVEGDVNGSDDTTAPQADSTLDTGAPGDEDTASGSDSATAGDARSDCAQEEPQGAACNPYCQAGCEAGVNCTVSSNTIACVPAGTAGVEEPCTASADCQVGLACVPASGTEGGHCHAFCGSDADCASEQSCTVTLPLSGELAVNLCTVSTPTKNCDLLTQTGCAPEEGCYPVDAGWACLPAGSASVAAGCQQASDCAPGGVCMDEKCRSVCSAWVDAPLDIACAEQCAAYVSLPPLEWGAAACTPPTSASTCTFWQQDCGGADDACYVLGGGATCLPAGSMAEGSDCALLSDCAEGLLCVDGSCVQPCSIDENVPPPASICQFTCPGYTILNFESAVGLCN